MSLYGGIEAGGTKFVCAVGSNPNDLCHKVIDTTTPDETISRAIAYFKEQSSKEKLSAIGIGSFGPIDLNKKSKTYGFITSTPKPNWEKVDFVGAIRGSFNIPIGFDTDVNAAALGEYEWGAAQCLTNFIYLTIGTGIGGGGMINGGLLHGLLHPEMGHIFIPRDYDDKKAYEGNCPRHKDCFEGLASGPAIKNRWGKLSQDLSEDHPAWKYVAKYISYALVNYICTLSPQRIIIGGGVMKQEKLLPLIHKMVQDILNNYIQLPQIMEDIQNYIVPPALQDKSGILGAIALAKQAQVERSI
jgi:fructokinase